MTLHNEQLLKLSNDLIPYTIINKPLIIWSQKLNAWAIQPFHDLIIIIHSSDNNSAERHNYFLHIYIRTLEMAGMENLSYLVHPGWKTMKTKTMVIRSNVWRKDGDAQ